MKKTLIVYAMTAGAAVAHPGHDAAALQGQAHWLGQADHIAVVALVAALGAVIVYRRPRAMLRRILRLE
ncbi:hypothetical protein [Actibacterium lipolyticum]|uniref:Uncharacterized protein n=1 Tax=Actibacterium lipolyticum TaxID=1524263 RepID=A0A238JJU9_9RHOB|nr:hypothetical protein [Actibacterium lipolyticum]SMX30683.1 hypothetical protein COL8621_00044 [Actibacterium lipolyticum]